MTASIKAVPLYSISKNQVNLRERVLSTVSEFFVRLEMSNMVSILISPFALFRIFRKTPGGG